MVLSQEDREHLKDLIGTDAWKAVINLGRCIVYNHEQALLNCDISDGDTNRMFIAKARLDGARTVISGLEDVKRRLRVKED